MKIATLVARLLLGLMFLVFGANNVVHFMPMPPMPPSDATTYTMILVQHHIMAFVGLLMVIAGLLLLVGRYVPLALLGPILVNILLFHFMLMNGTGAVPGLVATVLELFLILVYRKSFRGRFDAAPEVV